MIRVLSLILVTVALLVITNLYLPVADSNAADNHHRSDTVNLWVASPYSEFLFHPEIGSILDIHYRLDNLLNAPKLDSILPQHHYGLIIRALIRDESGNLNDHTMVFLDTVLSYRLVDPNRDTAFFKPVWKISVYDPESVMYLLQFNKHYAAFVNTGLGYPTDEYTVSPNEDTVKFHFGWHLTSISTMLVRQNENTNCSTGNATHVAEVTTFHPSRLAGFEDETIVQHGCAEPDPYRRASRP